MTGTTRRSGILLHPTSLSSPGGIGTLGAEALEFIDFLALSGQRCWQLLPLGPLSYGNSPYAATSAFAGNPLLVDLAALEAEGWLDGSWRASAPPDGDRVDFVAVMEHRRVSLAAAFDGFEARATPEQRADFASFCVEQRAWLDDYALFVVASEQHGLRAWVDWPEPLRLREPAALAALRIEGARGAGARPLRSVRVCAPVGGAARPRGGAGRGADRGHPDQEGSRGDSPLAAGGTQKPLNKHQIFIKI
jgi:4-alpha-glucanotransferase